MTVRLLWAKRSLHVLKSNLAALSTNTATLSSETPVKTEDGSGSSRFAHRTRKPSSEAARASCISSTVLPVPLPATMTRCR